MARIIFIRHGVTAFNQKRLLIGRRDDEPSAKGKKQAGRVAKALAKEKISAIYSSPQKRALFVAKKIAAKREGIVVRKAEVLKEVDFGDFEGTSVEAFFKWWGAHCKKGKYAKIPNGENFYRKERSLVKFVAKLCKEGGAAGKTVVVSHGTAIRLVLCGLGKCGREEIYKLRIPHASISVWNCGKKKFEKFADTAHLGDLK